MNRLPDDLRIQDLITALDELRAGLSPDDRFDATEAVAERWLKSIGLEPDQWMLNFVQGAGIGSWRFGRGHRTYEETISVAEREFITSHLFAYPLEVFTSDQGDRYSGISMARGVTAHHLNRWASGWNDQQYSRLEGKVSEKRRDEMHSLGRLWWSPSGGWDIILPIGDGAIRASLERAGVENEYSDGLIAEMAPNWAITDGDVLAAFVVPIQHGRTSIAAFPLVIETPGQTDAQKESVGPRYTLTGDVHIYLQGNPLHPEIITCIEGVQKWCKKFAGKPLGGGGMPPFINSAAQIKDAYISFIESMRRRPTQIELAEKLGTQERTLRRSLKRLGIEWRDL